MPTAEQNSIPRSTADKLVAAHDGDVALLYIWLDLNGEFDADRPRASFAAPRPR